MTQASVGHILALRNLTQLFIQFDSPDCVPIDSFTTLNEHSKLEVLGFIGPVFPDDMLARLKAALPYVTGEVRLRRKH